jgi:hypothetical protein
MILMRYNVSIPVFSVPLLAFHDDLTVIVFLRRLFQVSLMVKVFLVELQKTIIDRTSLGNVDPKGFNDES